LGVHSGACTITPHFPGFEWVRVYLGVDILIFWTLVWVQIEERMGKGWRWNKRLSLNEDIYLSPPFILATPLMPQGEWELVRIVLHVTGEFDGEVLHKSDVMLMIWRMWLEPWAIYRVYTSESSRRSWLRRN
jgi:hypothetical protein